MNQPESKSPTELLDLQRKMEETRSGRRPVDSRYPYIPPDYDLPFLHIGTERQLFLDNFILDHLEDVERIFPEPVRPEEPLVRARDLPWENATNSIFPVAALQDPDDGKFKIWYCKGLTGDPYADVGMVMCYAESDDCLHWEKPLDERCIPYEDHRATNIVLEDSGHHIALVLNHDPSDPARKFLLVYNPGRAKAAGKGPMSVCAASPDGLQWTVIHEETPWRHHHFQRTIWDASIQRWISYSQYSHHWNFLHRKRQIGRQESTDFINWSPKEVVLSGDWDPNLPPHIEFHDMSVRKVGGLYIGTVAEFASEPLWCVRDDHNWRDTAYVGLSLYVSRDGKRWQRAGGAEQWVTPGPSGSYDHGFVSNTLAGQLVCNGKTYIFYGARSEKQHWYSREEAGPDTIVPEEVYAQGKQAYDRLAQTAGEYPRHDHSISALILREDGWAALKPAGEHGKVITRQFVFEGQTLKVNADTYGGYLRVEILDPYFNPYKGFSTEACDPVCSDHPDQVWHTVTWTGSADVRPLWNKPVRLVFHLHHASLYAFQFMDDGAVVV